MRAGMLTGRRIQRVVDVIGHPSCEAPVVGTVLKLESVTETVGETSCCW